MSNSNPPRNLSDFQRRIDRYRRDRDIAPDRFHQRVSSELFFSVLDEAKNRGIIPMFLLKGGMAMELRFGIRARASGDVDIGLVATASNLLSIFDRALAVGFAGFTFRRKGEPYVIGRVNAVRLEVQIALKGRPFSVLNVDLNEATYESATEVLTTGVITELGLPGPVSVPVLEPYLQIAQKLHGATEPSRADYINNRYRDLLDVLIFSWHADHVVLPTLRRTVIEEFSRREHHRHWPPLFELPAHWVAPLAVEARSLGLEQTDPVELSRQFLRFVAAIEGIPVKDNYEYRFVSLALNLVGRDPVPQESENEVRRLESEGWRVVNSMLRPGYQDQLLFVLERGGPLPRLQLRMESQTLQGQSFGLVGELRNISDEPANKVRIFMTGVEGVWRLGNVTSGDTPVRVVIPYEGQPARVQQQQFPAVFAQFLTDDGRKIQQAGHLDDHSDASQRHAYTLQGLDAPIIISRFGHRHDPWEEQ